MWNKTLKQIKRRWSLSASQKLTHSSCIFKCNQGPVAFIWNSDKNTHIHLQWNATNNSNKCRQWRGHADPTSTRSAPIRPVMSFWGSRVPQNGRFPTQERPWTNEPPYKIWRRYSFILAGEIRNRTNKKPASPTPWMPSAGDATDSSDFGHLGKLLREQSSPKWEIPCPGRRWTTVLAKFDSASFIIESSTEKYVTVQIYKHTNKRVCLS